MTLIYVSPLSRADNTVAEFRVECSAPNNSVGFLPL